MHYEDYVDPFDDLSHRGWYVLARCRRDCDNRGSLESCRSTRWLNKPADVRRSTSTEPSHTCAPLGSINFSFPFFPLFPF